MAKFMGATRTSVGRAMKYKLESGFKEYSITPDLLEAKAIPRRQVLKSQIDILGAKTVRIYYGPHKVPSTNTNICWVDMEC
jgi:hypothetical protein